MKYVLEDYLLICQRRTIIQLNKKYIWCGAKDTLKNNLVSYIFLIRLFIKKNLQIKIIWSPPANMRSGNLINYFYDHTIITLLKNIRKKLINKRLIGLADWHQAVHHWTEPFILL